MGLDRKRWPELMLGLDDVRVLEVVRDRSDRLHLVIETTDDFGRFADERGVRVPHA